MHKINLLPDELTVSGADFKKIFLFFLAAAYVAGSVSGYFLFLFKVKQAEAEKTFLQNNLAAFEPEINKLDLLTRQESELGRIADDLKALSERRVLLSPVILEINSKIPADIRLTCLQFASEGSGNDEQLETAQSDQKRDGNNKSRFISNSPDKVVIQGESGTFLPVSMLLSGLCNSKSFKDVRVIDIHRNGEKGAYSFSLSARLNRSEN